MQGGGKMAEALLVNRTRFTSSLKNELMRDFNRLAEETRIPKSRLMDEAIEDLWLIVKSSWTDKRNP